MTTPPAFPGIADPRSPGSATTVPVTATFGLESLAAIRRSVGTFARSSGLPEEAVDGFILAVNEITANAIAHGGGEGSLRLWTDSGDLHCRVSDQGPGVPADRLDCHPPPLTAPGGRGLWLAHQFCQLDIHTSRLGTTIELTIPLDGSGATPDAPRCVENDPIGDGRGD